ncbi:transcription factor bHLH146 [Prosopis cineraria]|uniref:transcription factor bHLH146 n=1 Tax=Prosopis cineraria TaxID=364024 RepID=UPI00241072BF|nr:transcription factor bHLH146 [Prosopis cineraria]
MEGSAAKRRRVYSLEPNKIVEAVFARKYLSYLVPALTKMKENTDYNKEEHSDSLKKGVKFEVDMAMVLSAQGSAWSNALKLSLLREHNQYVINGGALSSSSSSSSSSTARKLMANCEYDQNLTAVTAEENEKEVMRRLRRLVPGGEEISSDQEMLAELKSYVRCLQMQVNILQCLAQAHSF